MTRRQIILTITGTFLNLAASAILASVLVWTVPFLFAIYPFADAKGFIATLLLGTIGGLFLMILPLLAAYLVALFLKFRNVTKPALWIAGLFTPFVINAVALSVNTSSAPFWTFMLTGLATTILAWLFCNKICCKRA